MKKKIFILLIMFFCCYTNIVSAKTIVDVECDYKLLSYAGDNTYLTDIHIQIVGYNDGQGGTIKAYYKDKNNKFVEFESNTDEWLNYGNTSLDSAYNDKLSMNDIVNNKKKLFITRYKEANGACPVIYNVRSAVSDGIMYVQNGEGGDNDTFVSLKASEEKYKSDDGKWYTKNDFYKDDQTGETTVKPDLVCTYNMNFDMYNIVTDVQFITKYDPKDNAKKTYQIKVGQVIYDRQTLNDEIAFQLRNGGSEQVQISSEQLKKIFLDGKCLERNKIFHYHNQSTGNYTITTNEQEAKDNGTAGRYDDGDAPEPGTQGSANIEKPDIDIMGGSMTCEQLLGPGLTLVLKFAINAIRIIGVIVSIVMGMVTLLPAVNKGDAGELQKAGKKCIWIAVVLIITVMLPTLIRVIGKLFGFDISCI